MNLEQCYRKAWGCTQPIETRNHEGTVFGSLDAVLLIAREENTEAQLEILTDENQEDYAHATQEALRRLRQCRFGWYSPCGCFVVSGGAQ